MTEILFYITEGAAAQQFHELARRIAEKALQSGHRVYIHQHDRDAAAVLDDWLWREPATGFLPHALAGDEADTRGTPVVIGWGDNPGEHQDVLINLGRRVPDFFTRFQRVAELVTGDENARREARQRWKFYRERGFPVRDHRLGG